MQHQEENSKGFTTLEVIVVLCIVGIISAIAYPNVDSWNTSRKVRSSAINALTVFDNINSQVQRGLYAYTQVYVNSEKDEETGNQKLIIVSRGMTADTLANKISEGGDFRDSDERCYLDPTEWDDDGATVKRPEVMKKEFTNISADFIGEAAVCFSKDGRWYSTSEFFADESSFSLYGEGGCCDDPLRSDECIYRIGWSRFGNIKLEKYNAKKGEEGGWVAQ